MTAAKQTTTLMQPVIEDRLYIVQGIDSLPMSDTFRWFRPHASIKYHPLCDDFGPMNMSCVISFAQQLEEELVDQAPELRGGEDLIH